MAQNRFVKRRESFMLRTAASQENEFGIARIIFLPS